VGSQEQAQLGRLDPGEAHVALGVGVGEIQRLPQYHLLLVELVIAGFGAEEDGEVVA